MEIISLKVGKFPMEDGRYFQQMRGDFLDGIIYILILYFIIINNNNNNKLKIKIKIIQIHN